MKTGTPTSGTWSLGTWLAVGLAAAIIAALVLLVVGQWGAIGSSTISGAGWLAMAFGIIVTLALGVGLMALVFISSRRGYDDPGSEDR